MDLFFKSFLGKDKNSFLPLLIFFALLALFVIGFFSSRNSSGTSLLLAQNSTATSEPIDTPTSTPVPSATIEPTKTATPKRPTKTATITPSSTATVTPSPTPKDGFISGRVITKNSCSRTVVHGVIRGDRSSLNDIQVRVWSSEVEEDDFLSQPSGSISKLGPGGYEVLLDNRPKAGSWQVAVVNHAGMPVSQTKVVETTRGDCRKDHGKQAVQINFSRRRGTLGHAVPIRPPYQPATPTPIPYSTPDGITRTLKVPIMMYHYISEPPPDSDIYRLDLSIEPELFRAQLVRLREQNYNSITLSDLYYAIEAGKPLPENPIVLTFDDGYLDNYEYAFPIMKEEGFVGTFFIITNLVEEWNVNYMNWPQIQEMKAAGMEFGSHTKSHASLPGMAAEDILEQLTTSKAILEAQLDTEIVSFSYPFGHFDDGIAHLTKEADYKIAVTTRPGIHHSNGNIRTLRRIRVNGGLPPQRLTQIIYYWRFTAESDPN